MVREATAAIDDIEELKGDAMDDKERGFYGKFKVERADGSSGLGQKHERCAYFVLDLDHDQHAAPAIKAYAESCRKEFPALAGDLSAIANGMIFPTVDHKGEIRHVIAGHPDPAKPWAAPLAGPPVKIGLREWLAGQALPAVITHHPYWPNITDHNEVAALAVRVADALIHALAEPQQ